MNDTYKSGFTLLETLVAVSILILLSSLGVANMISFQNKAKLDSFTSEFKAYLEMARSKSVNGEVPQGMNLSDFDENNLPSWGIRVLADEYILFAQYKKFDGTEEKFSALVQKIVNANLVPTGEVTFDRITAHSSPACLTSKVNGSNETKQIYIDSMGNITDKCP